MGSPVQFRQGVYPRVCGGTTGLDGPAISNSGLSPRVRGNRGMAKERFTMMRSIPACAGEPSGATTAAACTRVYPRVCGGTPGASRRTPSSAGLSPRVRGNRSYRPRLRRWRWSIPACAGEPPSQLALPKAVSVYPRVCGGTAQARRRLSMSTGLSPRVRGNPILPGQSYVNDRSIPACAGEPGDTESRQPRNRVYPRVCGGTSRRLEPSSWLSGLSPRVRGNPAWSSRQARGDRSIPACAGEP